MATSNLNAAQGNGSARNRDLIRFVKELVSGTKTRKDDAEIERLLGLSSDDADYDEIEKIVKQAYNEDVQTSAILEIGGIAVDMLEMTAMHVAAFAGPPELMKVLIRRKKVLSDINKQNAEGRTPLHLASLAGKLETVEVLLRQPKLIGALEDKLNQTPFEIAVEVGCYEIERALLERRDMKDYLKTKRANRTVYANGTSAILVGAAVISSITFAGWLQPPLGYQKYYQYPRNATMLGAPPDDFEQYMTISEHSSLKVFCISNSLSFFFSIAAILAGAGAMVPRNLHMHELAEVKRVRGALYLAAFAFSWAVLFVVVAFSAAGFATLPPILKYEWYLIVTVGVGCLGCYLSFTFVRLSDPSFFFKYFQSIDPAYWVSQSSHLFERFCEWSGFAYEPVESRLEKRKEFANKRLKAETTPKKEMHHLFIGAS